MKEAHGKIKNAFAFKQIEGHFLNPNCMRPATLICTSQAGNTKRLTGSEIAPGVVAAVSPGKRGIWVIGGASREQQTNCFSKRPSEHHANFYGNANCKKYAQGFAREMGSSFKGKVAGLPAGDGRYLKNCRFEETKGWVKPAGM